MMPAHSKRTPQLEVVILQAMTAGTTLVDVCRANDLHPTTWNDWCAADEGLGIAHARARNAGFDAIANRIRQTVRGKTEAEGGDSTGDVQRDKLIAETDLKLLAKWDPKRYGDKLDVAHTVGLRSRLLADDSDAAD